MKGSDILWTVSDSVKLSLVLQLERYGVDIFKARTLYHDFELRHVVTPVPGDLHAQEHTNWKEE